MPAVNLTSPGRHGVQIKDGGTRISPRGMYFAAHFIISKLWWESWSTYGPRILRHEVTIP